VAECMGPTRAASCTLIDRQDGMFELVIKPREVGSHKLLITYGFEPVPGLLCLRYQCSVLFAVVNIQLPSRLYVTKKIRSIVRKWLKKREK